MFENNPFFHIERTASKNPEVLELQGELKDINKELRNLSRMYLTIGRNRQKTVARRIKIFVKRKKQINNTLDIISD